MSTFPFPNSLDDEMFEELTPLSDSKLDACTQTEYTRITRSC